MSIDRLHDGAAAGALALAEVLLRTAAEVEAAEAAIKRAVLDAAEARDFDRITSIVTRWIGMPAVEVLEGVPRISGNGLDPCGRIEVIVADRGGGLGAEDSGRTPR